MKGLDFTTPIDLAKAKQIKAAGYDFICRYVVPEKYAWKRLTTDEAKAASEAGLYILSVYESSEWFMKGGAAQAKIDAKVIRKELHAIGQPHGSAIYFAADFDVTTSYDLDCIERYLRQMTAELPDYQIGIYGEYEVIEVMGDRKACKHFWQTYAWSHGKWSKYANVHQYQNGKSLLGLMVDLDESFGDEGFWSLRMPEKVEYPVFNDMATVDVIDAAGKIHCEKAFISKGISYIPVRFVAEKLGCEVSWDGKSKTITIKQ